MARRTPCITTAVRPNAHVAVLSAFASAWLLALDIDVSAARPLTADKLKAAVSARSNQHGVAPPPCAASQESRIAMPELKVTQSNSPPRRRPSVNCLRILRFNHGTQDGPEPPILYVRIWGLSGAGFLDPV